jgi:hypothetical protein
VFLVWAGALAERGVGSLERRGMPAVVSHALAACLIAGLAFRATTNLARARAEYPISAETRFGRVDFHSEKELALFRTVRRVTAATPRHDLFCYPVYASMYLMAGAENPTRNDMPLPNFTDRVDRRRLRHVIRERRTAHVIALSAMLPDVDPMWRYIRRHYRCVDFGYGTDPKNCVLFARVGLDQPRP